MGGIGRALCFGALCLAAVIREEAPAFMQLSAAPKSSSTPPPAAGKKPFAAAMQKVRRKLLHEQVTAAIAKVKQNATGFPRFRRPPSHPDWAYRHRHTLPPPPTPPPPLPELPPAQDRIGYEGRVPHFIWQTYTTRKIQNAQIQKSYDSWSKLNPKWHHELLVDEDVAHFFKEHYDDKTNAVFNALPLGAMKADMFRYAVMYTYGGVYSDIDVEALVPIGAWLGDRSGSCKVVMGLENGLHFCQWTFAALPRQRVFQRAVELIVERVVAGGGLGPKGLNVADTSFVHYYTGPAVWTAAVIDVLTTPGGSGIPSNWTARNVTCLEWLNETTGQHAYASCIRERMQDALAMEGICMEDDSFFHGRNVEHLFHSASDSAMDGDSWRDAASMVADEQKVMNTPDYQQYMLSNFGGSPENLTHGVTSKNFTFRDGNATAMAIGDGGQNATAQGVNASIGGLSPQDVLGPALDPGAPASSSADTRLAALVGSVQGNVSTVRNATNRTVDLGDQLAQWRRPPATWSDAKAAAHLREEQKQNGL